MEMMKKKKKYHRRRTIKLQTNFRYRCTKPVLTAHCTNESTAPISKCTVGIMKCTRCKCTYVHDFRHSIGYQTYLIQIKQLCHETMSKQLNAYCNMSATCLLWSMFFVLLYRVTRKTRQKNSQPSPEAMERPDSESSSPLI